MVLVLVSLWLAQRYPWMARPPAESLPPIRPWLTDLFTWLATEAGFGPWSVRGATRALAGILLWPLDVSQNLLARGFREAGLPPLPWIALVALVGWLGWRLDRPRTGLLAGMGFLYLALFGVWQPAMQTLSLVLVAVPLSAFLGMVLGITASRLPGVERTVTGVCDLLQSIPHMAYLGPVIVFFGFGQVPALLATATFAMPPMARCTLLGIRRTPMATIEAARMAGCTDLQRLFMVELPSARPTLLLGLYQTIMASLAMVVITALIGAVGLGEKLLFALQQLRIGTAVEIGVAVVVLAVVLDRLSRGAARRAAMPVHSLTTDSPFDRRGIVGGALVLVSALLWLASIEHAWLQRPPAGWTMTTAPFWDGLVRWVAVHLFEPAKLIRDDLTVGLLVPWRNLVLQLPWTTALLALGLLGWRLGGPRLAATVTLLLLPIPLAGLWVPALLTVYVVSIATLIALAIGLPLGILAAESPPAARVLKIVCDTVQTFPSFIYLIPVVMLLRVGDASNILAIVLYASVPAILYTQLGLAGVPMTTLEAARACGATRLQLLTKVKLPLARPEILLGLNQVVMMALIMTSITALIGSRDLGQEILKALPEQNTGRGLMAGLSIAFLGIITDRLVRAWARGGQRHDARRVT